MPDHPFHLKIGTLVRGLCLPSIREIWMDPACNPDSPGVITLFHGTGPDRVRFCLVDILITLPNKVVIIEIEESDVKPLHLFGKFFASALSTHLKDTEISQTAPALHPGVRHQEGQPRGRQEGWAMGPD